MPPGEFRFAESVEIGLDAAERYILGGKMKVGDNMMPLSMRAVEIQRVMQKLTGHGKFFAPAFAPESAV